MVLISLVFVGSMMSNFPRMALQMRVQTPLEGQHRYLALDGRTWCTRHAVPARGRAACRCVAVE